MLTRDYIEIRSNPEFMKNKWGTTFPIINANPLVLNQALLDQIPKELLEALESVEIKLNEKNLTVRNASGIASAANNDNLVLTDTECSALNVFITTQYLKSLVWFLSLKKPLLKSKIEVTVERRGANLLVTYSQKEKKIADYNKRLQLKTTEYKIKCTGTLNSDSTFTYNQNIETIFIRPAFLTNNLLPSAKSYLMDHSSLTQDDLYVVVPFLMDEALQGLFNISVSTSSNEIKKSAAELINLYFTNGEVRKEIVGKLTNLETVAALVPADEKSVKALTGASSGSKTTEYHEEVTPAHGLDTQLDLSTQPASHLVTTPLPRASHFTADELELTEEEGEEYSQSSTVNAEVLAKIATDQRWPLPPSSSPQTTTNASSREASTGSVAAGGDSELEETMGGDGQHSPSHLSTQPSTTVNNSPSLTVKASSGAVTELSLTTGHDETKPIPSTRTEKISEKTQTPSQFQLDEEQAGMTTQQIFTLHHNNLNKIIAATIFDARQIESCKKLEAAISALTPQQLEQSQLLLIDVIKCANIAVVDPINAPNLTKAQELVAPLNRARHCKIALALTAIITGAAILLLSTALTVAAFTGVSVLGLEAGTSILAKAIYIGCGFLGLSLTLAGPRLFSQTPLNRVVEASTEITQNARMSSRLA